MYFLEFSETKQLFDIFNRNNIEARFVGGCVRDYLRGVITDDFDIAINCEINRLCSILENAGINIIRTGIQYSSITAIINNKKFEITSLRRDTKCNGRHCNVSQISNFKQDAMRRDFTINALYMDQHGQIFDYFGGKEDLKNNVVRFIGEPRKRIQEDYLRIFRYYRFCAKYGDTSNRYEHIIKSLSNKIFKLSIERIQSELIKILHYKNNEQIIELMNKAGVINANIELYKNLLKVYPDAKTVLKLYILFNIEVLLHVFKLSRRYKKIINEYIKYETESLMYVAYKATLEIQQDIIVVKHLKYNEPIRPLIEYDFPKFPVAYNDICEAILHPGTVLKDCERWWVLNDFTPNKEECLTYIKNSVE